MRECSLPDLLHFPQQTPGHQFFRSTNLYVQPEVVPCAFRRSINPRPTADDTAISTIIFDEKQYIGTANGVVIVHYSPKMLKLFHLGQQGDIQKAWLWKSCQLKSPESSTRSGGVLLGAESPEQLLAAWRKVPSQKLSLPYLESMLLAPKSTVFPLTGR